MNRPALLSASYSLDWHDEFDGSQLNSGKWQYEWSGMRDAAYQSPEAVSLRDSCLVIATEPLGDGRWMTGGVTTLDRYMPTYGYFEARIKVPYQSGSQFWGAYWLWTPDIDTDGTEMDVMESFRHDEGLSHCAVHWDGYGTRHKQEYKQTPIDDPFGWHTYGILWEVRRTTFYVDGIPVFMPSAAPSSSNPRQFMRLTCHLMDAGAISNRDEMLVDWVRVWRDSP